ncbi:hypothetical protein NDU88_007104 [Pleurodeles waltl]|uniref:Uncharacterized protein n=1 Tax=Pleurodeles waltl TaxID=8319 RepID=A0AAV7SRK0_PLEWA|nr:hypothetical protein NDU88_007104 [Pleurodeles waltl]
MVYGPSDPGRQPESPRLPPRTQHPQAQGPALALAHPWLAERSAAAGAPGREDRARVRAPPARRTRPSHEGGTGERKGGAREPPRLRTLRELQGGKVKPLPRRNPRPPGTTLGGENRIEVPPRAWTTPESPAVLGRQGGLGEEEPGPAREPRLHPTRAGGWASPGRLARLGPPALRPRTAGVQVGPRPPLVARYPGPSTGPRVSKTRAAPPGPPGGTGGGGAARAPSRSGNTPRPRGGGRLPGRAPGNVLGIVEADSEEGKPDGVPGRHAARSADGRRRLPPASPAPAGGRTLRKVACDSWRWITRLARR